jgi:hypothetical protein
VGAGSPERMNFCGLCVTAAGGTVSEAGKGWPNFDTLGCDRALNSLPELERRGSDVCIQSSAHIPPQHFPRGVEHKLPCPFGSGFGGPVFLPPLG